MVMCKWTQRPKAFPRPMQPIFAVPALRELESVVPAIPRAKFLRNFSKRSAKDAAKFWRNISQIFVLQFPGKMAAKNFTKNLHQIKFFHCCNSGGLGAQKVFAWWAFCEMLSQYPPFALQGFFGGRQSGSAAVCHPTLRVPLLRRFPLEPCFRKEMPRFSPTLRAQILKKFKIA